MNFSGKNGETGSKKNSTIRSVTPLVLRFLPFLHWFDGYTLNRLKADFIGGLTVALVLIPQSMAYAQLADLPAYYGLYAAFLPPVIAALFGSSNQLATGPVAVVSLMTATSLAPLASAGSESFVAYAIILAFVVGLFQFFLGVFRLGMVVNFLSHPVVNGFTNAAAIIIATSQLSKLFGVEVDKAEHHYETVYNVIVAAVHHIHWPTFSIALLAFATMIILKKINPRIPNVLVAVVLTTIISKVTGFQKNETITLYQLHSTEVQHLVNVYNQVIDETRLKMEEKVQVGNKLREMEHESGRHSIDVIEMRAQFAKLDVIVHNYKERSHHIKAELRDYRFSRSDEEEPSLFLANRDLEPDKKRENWRIKVSNSKLDPNQIMLAGGGSVVGNIPSGLPTISVPKMEFSIILQLLPMAIVISLLGFMEAISIAKAMAARTGQRLDPNQELIGQGLANMIGSFGQSYPVSGSFSRSAVNIQAGAVTGLSNAFSSLIVVITLLFFTPLLYFLPQAVLAAIIMMAVIGLVNVSGFVHAWKAQKYDGAISIITFFTTLWFAPHLDKGIIIGVLLSLGLYLLRNMKPEIATLSRTSDGHFRSSKRWDLETCKHVAVIRFNNSLFFANVNYLEDEVLNTISAKKTLKHLLIVGNGMNELDASGEVLLSKIVSQVRELGLDVSFSGLNDHVVDTMKRTHLYEKVGEDHFYLSVAQAIGTIHAGSCIGSNNYDCPLLPPKPKGMKVSEDMIERLKHSKWAEELEKHKQSGGETTESASNG
ncbi:STAS domain-containing protein [bacterium]|nr:STAS domain-containing protein [bacterium]